MPRPNAFYFEKKNCVEKKSGEKNNWAQYAKK
jgi:hypothetical protein